MTTPIEKRAEILADLWIQYKDTDYMQDFIEYGDLGFPLAFMLTQGIVAHTDKTTPFINELFDIVLSDLDVENTGFDSIDEIVNFNEED